MSWMQTYTGRAFFPLEPNPDDIEIESVAHSLSMLCRYNGHCLRFYSVAEHCVLMCDALDDEHEKRWALLHEVSETYVGDMVRPVKYEMPEFMAIEDDIEIVSAGKFRLGWPMPARVKEYDTRIVVDEREQNMAPSQLPWSLLDGLRPLGVTLNCWSPDRAEAEFMSRYLQLFT